MLRRTPQTASLLQCRWYLQSTLSVAWRSTGSAQTSLEFWSKLSATLVIDPRKQVDYDDLNAARDEFEAMDAATKSTHKWFQRDPHAAREKEDYKRFFDTIGKHLVFYSESSGFYKYFQGAIEWLLANSDIRIHYVTSDPNDQVFELAKQQPRLIPYYLGQRRLITLFHEARR